MTTAPYEPDRGPVGKLRRRLTRLYARRPATTAPPRGLVSFTFDDAPASSVREAAPVLEARGLRGSWFIAAGLLDADSHLGVMAGARDVAGLHARGHEVACHTFSHADCARQSRSAFAADVERNRAALAGMAGEPRTFAYPYGEVDFGAKAELRRRYRLARTVQPGVVRPGSDLMQAPGVGLQGPGGEACALRWIARAARERAWLILFTHDVQARPTAWGCTPAALARVADAALAAGLAVVTAAEGAARVGAPS